MSRFVHQTKFGGSQDPYDQQGNCTRAALATLLGVSLEEAFDFNAAYQVADEGGRHWWEQFNAWLRERGWYTIWTEYPPPGLALGWVESKTLRKPDGTPELHMVVASDGRLLWDPNPRAPSRGEYVAEPARPRHKVSRSALRGGSRDLDTRGRPAPDAATYRPETVQGAMCLGRYATHQYLAGRCVRCEERDPSVEVTSAPNTRWGDCPKCSGRNSLDLKAKDEYGELDPHCITCGYHHVDQEAIARAQEEDAEANAGKQRIHQPSHNGARL